MKPSTTSFGMQRSVRGPWRRYVDGLAEHRPALHAYCRHLTGNVWDGEDLVQDTLVRVFSLLGKTDVQLENPKAYLIRTAANLWIDRIRRSAREHAAMLLEQAEPALTLPWEASDEYESEPMLAGFRTLHGVEGLNEIHRFEVADGLIVRVRTYCFCPETLAVVAEALGCPALQRPYRSPSVGDFIMATLGLRRFPGRARPTN